MRKRIYIEVSCANCGITITKRKDSPTKYCKSCSYSTRNPKQYDALKTHGLSRNADGTHTIWHRTYYQARRRCLDTEGRWFKYYRNVEFRFTSLQQWKDELGPYPGEGWSVDRIDNEKHYEPGNIRWATQSEQLKNARKRGTVV